MDKREPAIVRLQGASLDDRDNQIVAHGWLDIAAINNLRVGDYQREIMENRGGKKGSLRKAVEGNQRLPDIMLGMRGEKYSTAKGGDMCLEDDVYIIDGLQRVSAMRKFAADYPEEAHKLRIGAEVRFNTTRDTETELFTILNVSRKAMAPSVILRNKRNTNEAIATLYGLSMHDRNFPLIGKVCWDQQMHRGELMTAMVFAKVCSSLHRNAGAGRYLSNHTFLTEAMERMTKRIGLQNFRSNISTFFGAMDEVWGIRGIKYQDRATYLRSNFMIQLAGVFSDHEDFWEGNKLTIDADVRKKLKTFPMDDPTIIRLAGAGVVAGELLRRHIIDHLNRNKQASRYLVLKRLESYHKSNNKKAVK